MSRVNNILACLLLPTDQCRHYCQSISTALVGVWRKDGEGRYLMAEESNLHNITFARTVSLAKILCFESMIPSQREQPVEVGDIVGVVLPVENPAPLVGIGLVGQSTLYTPSTSSSTLRTCQLQVQPNSAPHLHATGTDCLVHIAT